MSEERRVFLVFGDADEYFGSSEIKLDDLIEMYGSQVTYLKCYPTKAVLGIDTDDEVRA